MTFDIKICKKYFSDIKHRITSNFRFHKILTSNDSIAGNGRIMVYQCLYLSMFIYKWIFLFPLIFFLSLYSGLSCSSDVTCLFLTEFLSVIVDVNGVFKSKIWHGCHSKNVGSREIILVLTYD